LHRNGNKENSSLMTQLIDDVITNLLSNVVWADALQIDGQICLIVVRALASLIQQDIIDV